MPLSLNRVIILIKDSAGMSQVLVLNASYEPLNITTWRRATVLTLKGKAETLEEDSSQALTRSLMLPTVIRLRYFVHVPFRHLPLTRNNILQRDKHSCQYCGSKGEKLSIDHVVPRSRGGEDNWENVTTACLRCNVTKGNRTPKEANMRLRRKPFRPLNSLTLEASKQIDSGKYTEWRKYVI
tara:strand:- start:4866 stop:5411 length:546 start_codon:yes stop_codon:yes gene_type:complete